MPVISIIMPYRNVASTLHEAVDSILRQTFTDYELIAINDHSQDESQAMMSSWDDARFHLFNNPGEGLVDALNFGLKQATSPWIARMDADDIMHPEKLEKQWQHILSNPNVDVISCQSRLFPKTTITDGFQEYIRWQNTVLSHDDFIHHRYVEMPLTNPTAIFRKTIVDDIGDYKKGAVPEDYEFWLRALHAGYTFEKLPEVLFDWRDSTDRYTRTSPACSREAFDHVRAEYLSRDSRINNNRPIVYCGAGRMTRKRANLLISKGYKPHVWVDIDPNKIGNQLNGIPVVAPDWITRNRHLHPFMLIYIASHGARDQLASWLEDNDFHLGQDYLAVG
jgi:glycosyltransferase involved in cell wall biosynthesis